MMLHRTQFSVPTVLLNTITAQIEQVWEPLAVALGAPAEGAVRDPAHQTSIEILTDGVPNIVQLRLLLSTHGLDTGLTIDVATISSTNWVLDSLRHLPAVQAGRFRIVGTHIEPSPRDWGIPLKIDAGLAFGTGHHETTTGCLMMLSRVLRHTIPQKVLDIGTGTGVLALAVKKYYPATQVVASDIDPIATQVARKNSIINHFPMHFITAAGARVPSIAAHAPYNLIIANILARPLIVMAKDVAPLLRKNGSIILAGLLQHQRAAVEHAYRQQGCVVADRITLGAWQILHLKRHT